MGCKQFDNYSLRHYIAWHVCESFNILWTWFHVVYKGSTQQGAESTNNVVVDFAINTTLHYTLHYSILCYNDFKIWCYSGPAVTCKEENSVCPKPNLATTGGKSNSSGSSGYESNLKVNL